VSPFVELRGSGEPMGSCVDASGCERDRGTRPGQRSSCCCRSRALRRIASLSVTALLRPCGCGILFFSWEKGLTSRRVLLTVEAPGISPAARYRLAYSHRAQAPCRRRHPPIPRSGETGRIALRAGVRVCSVRLGAWRGRRVVRREGMLPITERHGAVRRTDTLVPSASLGWSRRRRRSRRRRSERPCVRPGRHARGGGRSRDRERDELNQAARYRPTPPGIDPRRGFLLSAAALTLTAAPNSSIMGLAGWLGRHDGLPWR
jgi:hypothetical protein